MGIISLTKKTGVVTIKLRMKRTIFIFVVLLVVLGLITWVYFDNRKTENKLEEIGNNIEGVKKSVNWEAAPEDIRVPGVGEDVGGDVAAPEFVGPTVTNTSFRKFDIKISGNSFIPETFIVNKGDTINMNFTSTDKSYDFYQQDYGIRTLLPIGKVTTVQFEAMASGKFRFYCESCGGPDSGPVGYVIVAEK